MIAAALHQSGGGIQLYFCGNGSWSQKILGNSTLRFISKGLFVDIRLFRTRSFGCRLCRLHYVRALSSHNSLMDQDISTTDNCEKTSTEAALLLIRHGESFWNEKNLFTGWVDVPLTMRGVDEAFEAGKRIRNMPVDIIYTSTLIRAQMTAMLAMREHRCKKVPIIVCKESEQAEAWSQIFSEETKKQSTPVIVAWELNERMYGDLQGFNKERTAERYGKEITHGWRKSYDIPPPNGESLEMCGERTVVYFREHIEPDLQSGKHVMVFAHANSLRSIITSLDNLTSQEVINLEVSNGVPLLYIYKDGKFLRRGSPVGPTEAGVYAHTNNLALYRQKLDEMFD